MKTDETDVTAPVSEADAAVVAEEGELVAPVRGAEHEAELIAFEGEGLVETNGHHEDVVEGEVDSLVMAEESPAGSNGTKGASADVLPARTWRRFLPIVPRLGRKSVIALVTAFLLIFSGVAYATYDYDDAYDGKFLPGIVIANIDVRGMTPDEAFRAVQGAATIQLDRNITVRYKEKEWIVTPRELGARSNARALIDEAVTLSEGTGILKKAGMAVFGGTLDHERALAITYPRKGITEFIDEVAADLDTDPVDASIDYSSGWLEFVKAREGRRLLHKKSERSLRHALQNETDRVALSVKATEPEVTEHEWNTALLLRIGENKLYFYQDGKITHEYVVATGQPAYPTPTGEYSITEKRYMPTWVNPDPEGWGAGMPLMIPPGPGNPLGTRALNWSASGIRFHGTEATYSLGYNASHGCVRMAMSDVEELYEMVEVGTPIVSLVASPLDPMYTSSPDPGPATGSAN